MRHWSLFFIFLFILSALEIHAQPKVKRFVSLELEEVPGASRYEIELTSKNSSKTSSFYMKSPIWNANITPGEYTLRLRAYDNRDAPGEWSESTSFLVKYPGPDLEKPTVNEKIQTNEDTEYRVTFKWVKSLGAKKYELMVRNESGEKLYTESFSENSGTLKLPVAQNYSWTVRAISKNGEAGEVQDVPGSFTLIGKTLESPEIETPEDIWVDKVSWNKPEYAQSYTYMLQRKSENGKWQKLTAKEDSTELFASIDNSYPGGRFRIVVKADAPLRDSSKLSSLEFDVYSGDRSPAAVEEAKLRHSLEKPTPWYFVASYLVTSINYTARNPYAGNGANVQYDAFGGTGRLGLGYISPKRNDGFLGIIDLSGATVNSANITYASAEAHYVRRYTWGRNMFRPSAGFFYKEIYESLTKAPPSSEIDQDKISNLGPHVGFDLWRPLSSKYGVQINSRLYYGAFDMGTPNGKNQQPRTSYQIGLLGSYKLRANITGFLGWAHRVDKAAYESTTSSEDSLSAASPGDIQDVTIEGNFFNLLLEWGF